MSFLGVRVPNEITRLLSEIEVPGEKVPRDHQHITMLYVGKETPIDVLVKVILAAYEVTSKTKPFTVMTQRVTSFSPNPDDGVPIIAAIESPPLHDLVAALRASLDKAGVSWNKKYLDYKPHVTLAYSQDPLVFADHAADKDIPPVEWGVGEVVLWGGDSGDDKLVVTLPLSILSKEAMYRAIVKMAGASLTDVPCSRCTMLGRRTACSQDSRGAWVCGSCGWSLWTPLTGIKTAHDADGNCAAECPCHKNELAHKVVDAFLRRHENI